MGTESTGFRPSKRNPNLLKELMKLAEEDGRTLNNLMEKILSEYVTNLKTEKKKKKE